MTHTDTFEKIAAILARQIQLDAADLQPGSSLESFGIDSFDLVEFAFHVEDEFNVDIGDHFAARGSRATTISDLVEAVETMRRKASSGSSADAVQAVAVA